MFVFFCPGLNSPSSLLLWLNYIAINLLTGHLFSSTLGHIVGGLQKRSGYYSCSDIYFQVTRLFTTSCHHPLCMPEQTSHLGFHRMEKTTQFDSGDTSQRMSIAPIKRTCLIKSGQCMYVCAQRKKLASVSVFHIYCLGS